MGYHSFCVKIGKAEDWRCGCGLFQHVRPGVWESPRPDVFEPLRQGMADRFAVVILVKVITTPSLCNKLHFFCPITSPIYLIASFLFSCSSSVSVRRLLCLGSVASASTYCHTVVMYAYADVQIEKTFDFRDLLAKARLSEGQVNGRQDVWPKR
ncbi:hypothetical protein L211DRAFT_688142 [Terfezia boudieri ATCC MYA-4762]|uniref:Uncharacterized protein n=1 Tax=Terfezia boudieri ATCC MYA-4762 TaxID=1051890 RepID=A0A3N4L7A6_9PEZI|nr:hypothetical protein L211DRAFT_688142 [Terfezia boudieri ATCC MYA-4762]